MAGEFWRGLQCAQLPVWALKRRLAAVHRNHPVLAGHGLAGTPRAACDGGNGFELLPLYVFTHDNSGSEEGKRDERAGGDVENLPCAEGGVGQGRAGGDDLAVFTEGIPETTSSCGVEFSEDIVSEQDGLHPGAGEKMRDLGEAQGEREAALLALGREVACRTTGYSEFAIVAVRTGGEDVG